MGWFTGLVLYLLIWWTALFAVLPIGAHPVADADPASGWRGAPARPMLGRKVLATTVLAGVIWLGLYIVISHNNWLSFRSGWLAMPNE